MINDQNFLMYKTSFSGNFRPVFSNLSGIQFFCLFKVCVMYLAIVLVYLAKPHFYWQDNRSDYRVTFQAEFCNKTKSSIFQEFWCYELISLWTTEDFYNIKPVADRTFGHSIFWLSRWARKVIYNLHVVYRGILSMSQNLDHLLGLCILFVRTLAFELVKSILMTYSLRGKNSYANCDRGH